MWSTIMLNERDYPELYAWYKELIDQTCVLIAATGHDEV